MIHATTIVRHLLEGEDDDDQDIRPEDVLDPVENAMSAVLTSHGFEFVTYGKDDTRVYTKKTQFGQLIVSNHGCYIHFELLLPHQHNGGMSKMERARLSPKRLDTVLTKLEGMRNYTDFFRFIRPDKFKGWVEPPREL